MTWLLQEAFWLIFGKLSGAVLVAIIAGAVAFFVPLVRRPAIGVAIAALGFATVYGWGVYDRHTLCTSQFAEAEKRFHDLEDANKKDLDALKVKLEGELTEKDQVIDTRGKEYEQKLRDLKAVACVINDDDVGGLR